MDWNKVGLIVVAAAVIYYAYRLVRRRGWWMLLIGFVHGLVFPGDIIGAYGLVAVLLANLLARKNYSVLYLIGGIISVLALVTYLAAGTLSGGDTLTGSGEQSVSLTAALLWVVTNALQWAVVLVVQVLIALIVPAAVTATASNASRGAAGAFTWPSPPECSWTRRPRPRRLRSWFWPSSWSVRRVAHGSRMRPMRPCRGIAAMGGTMGYSLRVGCAIGAS